MGTSTVTYLALSTADFWASMATDSVAFILALERVEALTTEVRAAEVEALAEHFSAGNNAIALEYRLVTASVL